MLKQIGSADSAQPGPAAIDMRNGLQGLPDWQQTPTMEGLADGVATVANAAAPKTRFLCCLKKRAHDEKVEEGVRDSKLEAV